MNIKQGISNQVSGAGSFGGSSFPGSVQYFSGVGVNKLGVDGVNAAITGPTSFSLKRIIPNDTDYPVSIAGGLSLTAADTLSFTDGTYTATLTDTFMAGDEIVVAIYFETDGVRWFMRLRRIA